MKTPIRFLMCAPDAFDVSYVINPWMEGNLNQSSREAAAAQWQTLRAALASRAQVELIAPQAGLPDMVFTANGGLIHGNAVVLARFRHAERQGEENHFKNWFLEHGFVVYELPKTMLFEGAGDALLDREGRWLWAGHGFRSELDSHVFLAKWLDLEVLSLRLVNHRFYHLDTCFCPLADGVLLYYPAAFDVNSNRLIENHVPRAKRIPVSDADAMTFACNAVNVDDAVFLNQASTDLKERLRASGFNVIETPLSEFMKSGGGAKCLTLRLDEPVCHAVVQGALSASQWRRAS
ncbi:MAG: dimethylarginine dimethylaminohydrolase family protein [Verrucomicrobia bacterium]|nr:dimethylarginine dimethylaminohydrolase family protein [Verrucomicrobiota bacterium]